MRVWLVGWFAASLVLLFVSFALITVIHLRHELLRDKWQRTATPTGPHLRGSFSDSEVGEITRDLFKLSIIYSLPLIFAALYVGHWLAKRSLRPMASVNEQLKRIGPKSLSQSITLEEADEVCRDLARHINELLARLDSSFTTIAQYSTQVAHELRTPLTILRMKLEQSAGKIDPELAEDFQEELARLQSYVERALLVARAEQGRLLISVSRFDLAALVEEMVNDYLPLAEEEERTVRVVLDRPVWVGAEPGLIRQVVQSLLGNALKHGSGEILVSLRRRNGRARVQVYNRQNIDGDTPEESLGMGLRVVRAILEAHDLPWRVLQDGRRFLVTITFNEVPPGETRHVASLNPVKQRGDESVVF